MRVFAPGPRRRWAKIGLQVILGFLSALFLFRIAGAGMVLGAAMIAGGAEVTAQMDSETRFLSTLALVYVVIFIFQIKNFGEIPTDRFALRGHHLPRRPHAPGVDCIAWRTRWRRPHPQRL